MPVLHLPIRSCLLKHIFQTDNFAIVLYSRYISGSPSESLQNSYNRTFDGNTHKKNLGPGIKYWDCPDVIGADGNPDIGIKGTNINWFISVTDYVGSVIFYQYPR